MAGRSPHWVWGLEGPRPCWPFQMDMSKQYNRWVWGLRDGTRVPMSDAISFIIAMQWQVGCSQKVISYTWPLDTLSVAWTEFSDVTHITKTRCTKSWGWQPRIRICKCTYWFPFIVSFGNQKIQWVASQIHYLVEFFGDIWSAYQLGETLHQFHEFGDVDLKSGILKINEMGIFFVGHAGDVSPCSPENNWVESGLTGLFKQVVTGWKVYSWRS